MFHLVIYKKSTGEIRRVISRKSTVELHLSDLGFSSVLHGSIKVVSQLGQIKPNEWRVEKETLVQIKNTPEIITVPGSFAAKNAQVMKLVFIGDKPTDKTGFGTQYALLERGLKTRGCQVQYLGYQEIPRLVDMDYDFVIVLSDYLSIQEMFPQRLNNWIFWFALESSNWPREWSSRLKSIPTIVPMTQFGFDALREKKIQCVDVIPHGISLDEFRPIPLRQRGVVRRENKVDSCFVISYLGTNVQRKHLDRLIESYAKFVSKYDNDRKSILLLKTKIRGAYNVPNLIDQYATEHAIPELNKMIKILDKEMDTAQINEFINISDLGFNATSGEGFCVPIVEYMACGVPYLIGNHTSAVELLQGFPLIEIEKTEIDDRFKWTRYLINTDNAATLLNEYFLKWKKNEAISKFSLRERASQFAAQRITDAWDILLQDLEQSRLDREYKEKAQTLLEIAATPEEIEASQQIIENIQSPTQSDDLKSPNWAKVF